MTTANTYVGFDIAPEQKETYFSHVSHYFNQVFGDNVVNNLTPEEQHEFFQMLNDHASLLIKIVPDVPILQHITGQKDIAKQSQFIDTYLNWESKQQ